jgi:ADP-ribose pyrophosphatase YjhB (NUDIX family)
MRGIRDILMGRESREPDQAAAVPVRRTAGELQICLIRRQGVRRWGIPKGFIDEGHTAAQAALTEAREEAGLIGRIDGPAVGTYRYSKWGGRLIVAVYVMQVESALPVWEEMDVRERRWTTLAEAERLLERHPVSSLWDAIGPRLEGLRSKRQPGAD